jgi:two-component system, LytTR family, sensor kinase
MFRQLNRYWKCQLIGWFIVAGVNFVLRMISPNANLLEQLYTNFSFIVLGIVSSHGLRWSYRRLHITDLPLLRMILPVFGLSLIATAVLIILMFTLLTLTLPQHPGMFTLNTILGNLVAIYPLMLMWSCFYLGSHYLIRWRESEVEKLELANALKDAQLNTLIGQINPHFMFNALNNIRALMLENVPQARDSLTQLSKVLRYGLTAPKHNLVSLQSELDTVQDFVKLASMQYEDRLQWQTNIEVQPNNFNIPPMMIQMLVENALKHGIAQRKGGGIVKLSIKQHQQHLWIQLSNDGNLANAGSSEESTRLGLNNIVQRLKILYNGAASFRLHQQGPAVVADLRIPLDL